MAHTDTIAPVVRIASDSLGERICALDRDGLIVLTNTAWDRFRLVSYRPPVINRAPRFRVM